MANNWERYLASQMAGLGLTPVTPVPQPVPPQVPPELLAAMQQQMVVPQPRQLPTQLNRQQAAPEPPPEREYQDPSDAHSQAVDAIRMTPEYAAATMSGMSDQDAILEALRQGFARMGTAQSVQSQGERPSQADPDKPSSYPVSEQAKDALSAVHSAVIAPVEVTGNLLEYPLNAINEAVGGEIAPGPEATFTPQEQQQVDQQAVDMDNWERFLKPQYEEEWPQERIQEQREELQASLDVMQAISAMELSPDDPQLGRDILDQQITQTKDYLEQLDAIEAAVYGAPEPDKPFWRRAIGWVLSRPVVQLATSDMARPGEWARHNLGGTIIHVLANTPIGDHANTLATLSRTLDPGLGGVFNDYLYQMIGSDSAPEINRAYAEGGPAGVWEYTIGKATEDMSTGEAILFKATMDTVFDPLNWIPLGAAATKGTELGSVLRAADVATNIPGEIVIGGVRLGYRGAKEVPGLSYLLGPGKGAVTRELSDTAESLAPRLEAEAPRPFYDTPSFLRPDDELAPRAPIPFSNKDYGEYIERTTAGESPETVLDQINARFNEGLQQRAVTAPGGNLAGEAFVAPRPPEPPAPPPAPVRPAPTGPQPSRTDPLADLAEGVDLPGDRVAAQAPAPEKPKQLGLSDAPESAGQVPRVPAAQAPAVEPIPRPNYTISGRGAFNDEDYAQYLDDIAKLVDDTPDARIELINQIDSARVQQPRVPTTNPTTTTAEPPAVATSSNAALVQRMAAGELDDADVARYAALVDAVPQGASGEQGWRQVVTAIKTLVSDNKPIAPARAGQHNTARTEDLIRAYITEPSNQKAAEILESLKKAGRQSYTTLDDDTTYVLKGSGPRRSGSASPVYLLGDASKTEVGKVRWDGSGYAITLTGQKEARPAVVHSLFGMGDANRAMWVRNLAKELQDIRSDYTARIASGTIERPVAASFPDQAAAVEITAAQARHGLGPLDVKGWFGESLAPEPPTTVAPAPRVANEPQTMTNLLGEEVPVPREPEPPMEPTSFGGDMQPEPTPAELRQKQRDAGQTDMFGENLGFANLPLESERGRAVVQWAKDTYARLAGTAPEHIPVEQAVKLEELAHGSFADDLARYGRIGERDRQWLNTRIDVRQIRWDDMTPEHRKMAAQILGIDLGKRTKHGEIKQFVDGIWAVGDDAIPTRGDLYKRIMLDMADDTLDRRLSLWKELIGANPHLWGDPLSKFARGAGRMARDTIMYNIVRAIPNTIQDMFTNMFVSMAEGQRGVTRLHAQLMKDVFRDSETAKALRLAGKEGPGPYRNTTEELNTIFSALDITPPATVDSMFGARFDEQISRYVEDSSTWWTRNGRRFGGRPGEFFGSIMANPKVKFGRNIQDDAGRRAAHADYVMRNFKGKQDEFYDGIRALAGKNPGKLDADEIIRQLEADGTRVYEQSFFSPDDVRLVAGSQDKALGDQLARDWRKALDELNRGGGDNATKLYFSYLPTRADETIGAPLMFHYWMTRASVQHARLALENPNLMATYMRAWGGMNRQDSEGVPTWAKMYTGLMVGPYGMMGFISPAAVLTGLSVVLDVNDVANDPSLANVLRSLPFHPLTQVAASIWLDERGADPTGTNQTRYFWKAAANFLVNEMGVGSPQLLGDPPADLTYRLVEAAKSAMPGASPMKSPSPKQKDTQTVKYYAAQYMQETYDPKTGGTLWQNPDGSITEQASAVMANIDAGLYGGDIEKEALRRFSVDLMAGRLVGGVMPLPITTLYPSATGDMRETAREGRQAERAPLELDTTSAPDNMSFIDPSRGMTTTERGAQLAVGIADAGAAQSGKLVAALDSYNSIGTEYMQDTWRQYNELLFTDASVLRQGWGGTGLHLNGEFVTWDVWNMLPTEARRIYLDGHLQQKGEMEEFQQFQDRRDAYLETHPELAGYKEWQSAVSRKGGDAMLSELTSGNYPAFESWWKTQDVKPANVTKVLSTPSAYLAANGWQPNLYDINDISKKPTVQNQNPLDSIMGVDRDSGYGDNRPFSALSAEEKAKRIYEKMMVYEVEMQQFYRIAEPYLGNNRLEDYPGPTRSILLTLLLQKGIKPPGVPSIVQDYQTWAAMQPRDSDNSVEEYTRVISSLGMAPATDEEDRAA